MGVCDPDLAVAQKEFVLPSLWLGGPILLRYLELKNICLKNSSSYSRYAFLTEFVNSRSVRVHCTCSSSSNRSIFITHCFLASSRFGSGCSKIWSLEFLIDLDKNGPLAPKRNSNAKFQISAWNYCYP